LFCSREELFSVAQLLYRLLCLPEMATLVRGVDKKAGPDAVADARVYGRSKFDLVDRTAAASAERCNDQLLSLKKSGEHYGDMLALCRFQVNGSLRADARGRLKNPREQPTPEIGVIRCIQLGFAGAGIGDDLLPDGEVGVSTDVEVLKTLGRRPGSGSGAPGTQLCAARLDENLCSRAYGRELSFQFVESLCPLNGLDLRFEPGFRFEVSRYTRINS
jgi:hypothetical protein